MLTHGEPAGSMAGGGSSAMGNSSGDGMMGSGSMDMPEGWGGRYMENPVAYPVRHIIGIVLYVFVPVGLALLVGLYFSRWRHPLIKARMPPLVLLTVVGTTAAMLVSAAEEELVSPVHMLCRLKFVGIVSSFTLFLTPTFIRLLHLRALWHLQETKAAMSITRHPSTLFSSFKSARGSADGQKLLATESARRSGRGSAINDAAQEPKRTVSAEGIDAATIDAAYANVKSLQRRVSTMYYAGWTLLSITPAIVYMIVSLLVDPVLTVIETGCSMPLHVTIFNTVYTVFHVIMYMVSLYLTRDMPDSFHIRLEITWTMKLYAPLFLAVSLCMYIPQVHRYMMLGWYNVEILFMIGTIGQSIIWLLLPVMGTFNTGPFRFHSSEYQFQGPLFLCARCKRTPDAAGQTLQRTTSGDNLPESGAAPESADIPTGPRLSDVLRTAHGMALFSKHLVTEFSIENIKFYKEVDKFRHAYNRSEPGERASYVLQIMTTYVDPSAPLMVNIPATMLRALQAAVKAEQFSAVMFNEAQTEIFKLMERDSFPRFLRSPLYQQYLSGPAETRADSADKPKGICPCFGRGRSVYNPLNRTRAPSSPSSSSVQMSQV